MSVAQQVPYTPHVGNGATTVFPYQYLLLAATDLTAYVDGIAKVNGVDYTISGIGVVGGGSVTFTVAPASGKRVDLVRTMRKERLTDYQNLGDFMVQTVNPDFDRAILLIQDLSASLSRMVGAPANELSPLMTLPAQAVRAGLFMAFDALGQPIASVGTGNDAALRTDLASTTVAADGSLLVGYRHPGAGSVGRTVSAKLAEIPSVLDFGADPTGVLGSLTAFNEAIAASDAIIIPPGTYTLSGQWLITGNSKRILTTGLPTIRSTDNANPVIFFDGGAAAGELHSCYLGPCLLDGGNHGLRLRSVHRSEFHARGKNHVTALLRTEFAVLNDFYLACTINDGAMSTVPAIGASLYRRGASENTVRNTFFNPIFEGIGLGFDFEDAVANTVYDGASEGCTTGGVRVRSGSDRNKFIGHFCEANGSTGANYDFRINANGTKLYDCTLASGGANLGLWIEGGRNNKMLDGFVVNSQVDAGSSRFKFEDVRKDSGTHTNNGVETLDWHTDADGVDFPRSRMDYLGFTVPTLLNAWTNYGSGHLSAGYLRNAFNEVCIRGTVHGGSAAAVIFTLDAGFRPPGIQRFYVGSAGVLTDIVIIEVQPDGDVVHIGGATSQVALDCIRFYV